MITYAALFLIAVGVSTAAVPLVRRFSFRVGRVVMPRKDRWHRTSTPTLGGMAIFIACWAAMIVYGVISRDWAWVISRWSLLVAAILMFGLGLIDDFKRITPPVKLAVQLLAAVIVIFFGESTIDFFPWPIANILLTIFWLVGITNAINLLDNMDGLAAGVALISTCVLCYFFWKGSDEFLLSIALSLAGAILGFLIFNFPPAKIFMGDSGSLFLGFMLAALAIARRTQASNVFAIVGVPTLLFLLPILDTTLVTITRLLRGQSPTAGGTDHTSHRLIAFGLSEKQAVFVLYGIGLISGIAAAGLEALDYDLSLVLIPLLLIVLSLFAAYLARLKVVTSPGNSQAAITRFIVTMTYRQRLFEILFDLMLIGVSYYLAFWTRSGLDMTRDAADLFLSSWPIALFSAYMSFLIFRVYRGVWKYVGFNDLIHYGEAVILAAILTFIGVKLVYPGKAFTPDIFLLYGIFLFLGLSGSRSSFRLLDRVYNQHYKVGDKANILILGAGDTGEFALRWILRTPDLGWSPVGFLDDDPLKPGQYIHGVAVLGGAESLPSLQNDRKIKGIIVTSRALLETAAGARLLQDCRELSIWVKILKLDFETVE